MAYLGPGSWANPDRPWFAKYWDRPVEIWASGTHFDDEMMQPLLQLTHLQKLTLHRTSVSEQWVREFQQRKPGVHVEVYVPGGISES